MHLIWYIVLFLVLVFGLGGIWFLIDIRFAQQWSLKRAELGAQDKWRELNAHFEAGLKCRRPMLLLFQRLVIPGLLEADYALHLSNQGEHERALVLTEEAVRKSATRLNLQLAVLPAQATVLLRLGRYAEAQQVIQFGRNLLRNAAHAAGSPPPRDIVMTQGLMELNLGHLNAALQLGTEASAEAVSDPARTLISGV